MNTPTTFSFSPTDYLRHWTLSWLLFLFLSATGMAADLTFTPAMPIVEINRTLTLTVSGTVGTVEWITGKGTIQGEGTQVTYLAPAQAGLDVVTVLDSAGNTGLVKIVITPPNNVSLEKDNWEIFTNRNRINAILPIEGQKTLWIGTDGGLEQRSVETGELERVITNLDGLPDNTVTFFLPGENEGIWVGTWNGLAYYNQTDQTWESYVIINNQPDQTWESRVVINDDTKWQPEHNQIKVLAHDGTGGLWIGTWGNGFAHRHSNGSLEVFNGLPNNNVYSLVTDGNGGIWVSTQGGLVHYMDGQLAVFNKDNSPLPDNSLYQLLADGRGGVWIGTRGGLVHHQADGTWEIFNPDNSELPARYIRSLLSDGKDGIWIGTAEKGLVHRHADGRWELFNQDNSNLPDNYILSLQAADDKGGLWIGTGRRGLVRRSAEGQWEVFNQEFPENNISSLLYDSNGGLWVGTWVETLVETRVGGLAYRPANGDWKIFTKDNSELPGNNVYSLHIDHHGNLWVGTNNGLASRQPDGHWETFNTGNLTLPDNQINSILVNTHTDIMLGIHDHLWVGTNNGLAYRQVGNPWQVFNTQNSELPDNRITSLVNDGQGGMWIGTRNGLVHLHTEGQWEVFNQDNTDLPSNDVTAILVDNENGLWVGTRGRTDLAHRSAAGSWERLPLHTLISANVLPPFFDDDQANLVTSLITDGSGGIWVATTYGGVAYRHPDGQWNSFHTDNSGLPHKQVNSLLLDGSGGVWVGTKFNGLAHLTFGQKTALCQKADANQCQTLQTNKRAAIIIAGGGSQQGNALWDTTESTSNYLYNVLSKRGFDHDEIYYLTPESKVDFNGDGSEDENIVDSPQPGKPLTVEDVRAAMKWAKQQGKLDSPLYLFFMDHGQPNYLQLSKLEEITAAEFKTFLDDYQTATGNDLILMVDACYSGTFSQQLRNEGFRRATISSTNDTVAYFDRASKQGFGRFFANRLDHADTFKQAFDSATCEQYKLYGATDEQKKLSDCEQKKLSGATDEQNKPSEDISKTTATTTGKTQGTEQIPQLYDGSDGEWLNKHSLNNLSLATQDDTLAIESATSSSGVQVGQPVTLVAKTSGRVKLVWATVRPPKMSFVLDTYGTPILVLPRLNLGTSPETTDVWQATWNEAVYNGNYLITFYAEDNEKNIASSEQDTVLTVTGGIDPPLTAQVQIHLEKDRYQRGEPFKATLTEELGWGYDLYAAVLFPDEQNFITLKNTNELRPLNEAKPWYAPRKPHSPLTLFELTLPADLPTGEYCLYGILSPAQNEVFEAKGLWVMDMKCFEIF